MKALTLFAGVTAAIVATGCGNDTTAPAPGPTELLSVAPTGGSTGVPTTGPLRMTFDHPMMTGMEQYLDLHRGDAAGPTVPITCTWSADRLVVACTPDQPLEPHSLYTFHAGGGMMDADDHPVDLGSHQTQNGGQWLMPDMMSGTHAAMPMGNMGSGWRGANGSYGMVFSFTTE